MVVDAGQRHDSTLFEATLDAVRIPRADGKKGRPKQRPKRLGADKAYSNQKIRAWCRARGIRAVIPLKADQKKQRLAQGKRLPPFDRATYRGRNIIERLIGWLKEFRAVATRYDKLATNFAAGVTLALIVRTLVSEF